MSQYLLEIRQSSVVIFERLLILEVIISFIHIVARLLAYLIGLNEVMLIEPISVYWGIIVVIQVFNLSSILSIIGKWINFYYLITPDKIVISKGILNKSQVNYDMRSLQSATLFQGFWGRIFNFGTIKLYNPALNEYIFLVDIPKPEKYLEIIQAGEKTNLTFLAGNEKSQSIKR